MGKQLYISLLLGAFMVFGSVGSALAVPTIAIDLDPGTLGIQSTLSVTAGTSFTADVWFLGSGGAGFLFDAFAFAADFNDAGAVLGLAGGTGSPTAGSVAATAPIFALDTFTGGAVVPGSPLTTSFAGTGMAFPLTAGFTGSSDGVGCFPLAARLVEV